MPFNLCDWSSAFGNIRLFSVDYILFFFFQITVWQGQAEQHCTLSVHMVTHTPLCLDVNNVFLFLLSFLLSVQINAYTLFFTIGNQLYFLFQYPKSASGFMVGLTVTIEVIIHQWVLRYETSLNAIVFRLPFWLKLFTRFLKTVLGKRGWGEVLKVTTIFFIIFLLVWLE